MSYRNLRNLLIFTSAAVFAANVSAAETIHFYSGGVGEGGIKRVKQMQDDYNVKLVYTGERGMYLSDVRVVIQNIEGEVILDKFTQGPFALIKLPSGNYTIESSVGDLSKKVKLRVGPSLRTININLPVKDEPANVPMYRNDALDALSKDAPIRKKSVSPIPAFITDAEPAVIIEPINPPVKEEAAHELNAEEEPAVIIEPLPSETSSTEKNASSKKKSVEVIEDQVPVIVEVEASCPIQKQSKKAKSTKFPTEDLELGIE